MRTELISSNSKAIMRTTLQALLLAASLLVGCQESSIAPHNYKTDVRLGDLYYTVIDGNGDPAVYAIEANGINRHLIANRSAIFGPLVNGEFVCVQLPNGMAVCSLTGDVLNVVQPPPADFTAHPILSPAGNKVVYRKTAFVKLDQLSELHVVNSDGSSDVVVEPEAASETVPVWSPDGAMIAYLKQGVEQGGLNRDSLFVINSDGTNKRFLTAEAVSMNNNFESLDWSPDGTRLVCVTETSSEVYEILLVDAASGATEQLTFDGLPKAMPVWSPDSRTIAYVAADRTTGLARMSVFTIGADGSDKRQYFVALGEILAFPQWSPDGAYIAMTEFNGNAPIEGAGLLKVLNISSGDVQMIDLAVYKAFWKK